MTSTWILYLLYLSQITDIAHKAYLYTLNEHSAHSCRFIASDLYRPWVRKTNSKYINNYT